MDKERAAAAAAAARRVKFLRRRWGRFNDEIYTTYTRLTVFIIIPPSSLTAENY